MPNEKTDKQGYSTSNPDEERDMGAKGGPTTSLGNPTDAHGVSSPYTEDTQTQLAAKSTENNTQNNQDSSNANPVHNENWITGDSKKEAASVKELDDTLDPKVLDSTLEEDDKDEKESD